MHDARCRHALPGLCTQKRRIIHGAIGSSPPLTPSKETLESAAVLFSRVIRTLPLLVALVFSCRYAVDHRPVPPTGADVEISGQITASVIPEASGMAPSLIRENTLWIINDSGNPPLLHAVDFQGRLIGSTRVAGVANRDWEDLAAFRLDGVSYLLIADVGDNAGRQDAYYIYILEEPAIDGSNGQNRVARPRGTIRFQYPDGPLDCEAVAVAPELNRIFLMSKRSQPPVLYYLELVPAEQRPVVIAERITDVRTLPAPNFEELTTNLKSAVLGSQPTAMDFAPNNRHALVLTYREAYLFTRLPWESWKSAFSKPPQALGIPPLSQAEAACFSADGRSVFVTSEKTPAPLVRIGLWNSQSGF